MYNTSTTPPLENFFDNRYQTTWIKKRGYLGQTVSTGWPKKPIAWPFGHFITYLRNDQRQIVYIWIQTLKTGSQVAQRYTLIMKIDSLGSHAYCLSIQIDFLKDKGEFRGNRNTPPPYMVLVSEYSGVMGRNLECDVSELCITYAASLYFIRGSFQK